MLVQGIIKESTSSWMAPAEFVNKKSGEIRLCVDYCEVNKRTSKHAYPLPLVDEVQDRLARSTDLLVFICKMDIGKYQSISQINTKLRLPCTRFRPFSVK